MSMEISLCMIVKDEELVIGRCLDAVKDIVDEIVIVDTGSEDDTKKIAQKYGAKIYDMVWENDFAKARNYSFSQATKSYIFWLDADDIVPKGSIKKIKELKANMDDSYDYVSMNYIIEQDESGNIISSIRRNRLVKKSRGFQWKGRVHEGLYVDGKGYESDINVIHKKEKAITDRNLQIFKEMTKNNEEFTTRDIQHYAKELYINGEYEEAIKQYKIYMDRNDDQVPGNKKSALRDIAEYYQMEKDTDNEIRYLFKSFEYGIPDIYFCYKIGNIFMKKELFDLSIYWHELGLKYPIQENEKGSIEKEGLIWKIYLALCVSYYRLGDIEKAIYNNEEAAKYVPGSELVQKNRKFFEKIRKMDEL